MNILFALKDPQLLERLKNTVPQHNYTNVIDDVGFIEQMNSENKYDLLVIAGIDAPSLFLMHSSNRTLPLLLMGWDAFTKRDSLIQDGCNVVNDEMVFKAIDVEILLKELGPTSIESKK